MIVDTAAHLSQEVRAIHNNMENAIRIVICFSPVLFLALVFAIEGADLARAACVYNKAGYPIYVNPHCGDAFRNNWTIHIGDYKCQEGMGGTISVRVMDPFDDHEIGDGACMVEVDAHGWVDVYQDGSTATITSKHHDGSHRSKCHIHGLDG